MGTTDISAVRLFFTRHFGCTCDEYDEDSKRGDVFPTNLPQNERSFTCHVLYIIGEPENEMEICGSLEIRTV